MAQETSAARMAEQMNDIHSRVAVIEAFISDFEPNIEKINKEINANVVALRNGFERDETIELLKKVGDSIPVFVELLDTMNASMGMLKDFEPNIEKLSKEVTPNITALRTTLETDETLVLLKKFGDNLPIFVELLDTMNASMGMLKDFEPNIEKLSKEVTPNITALRTSLEKEEVLVLMQKFGDNIDAFTKCIDVVGRLEESGNLDKLLNLAEGAADAVGSVDVTKPKKVGIFGLLPAMSNGEVQKTIGIALEIAKNLPGKLKK
jgi:uncharacterized protein YjgD (DUF1641 family)